MAKRRMVVRPNQTEPADKRQGKVIGPEYSAPKPPSFRGAFRGHTVYAKVKRQTGSIIFETADNELRRMKTFRQEYDAVWTWTGGFWVRDHRINVG